MSKKVAAHECIQAPVITNLRIETATLRQTTERMASDINEIKTEIKNISSKLDTELKDKVSRDELAEKLLPLYKAIDVNKTNLSKLIDYIFKYGVPATILLLMIANKLGINVL